MNQAGNAVMSDKYIETVDGVRRLPLGLWIKVMALYRYWLLHIIEYVPTHQYIKLQMLCPLSL